MLRTGVGVAAVVSLVLVGPLRAEVPSFCSGYPQSPGPGRWQSSRVFYSAEGLLTYTFDEAGNRIPDFSYAGYKYGEAALPVAPEILRLSPAAGDQTGRIQAALDDIAARPPDASGLRGALVLEPGLYEIAGTLRIRAGGVVLRGSGNGADPSTGTILRATGDTPHQRSVIVLGSGTTSWSASATARSVIVSPFVHVGSRTLEVGDPSLFAVGNEVIVQHPSTQAWIDALGGGGTPAWMPGTKDIVYFRRITAIDGAVLTLDAPVYNPLDRSLSPSYVAKASWNRIRQAGLENLRVDIETLGGTDENHAWSAVSVRGAEDSWIKGVVALHFGYAGVETQGALRVTVEDCQALDPVAIVTGGRMYNFSADTRSQLVLFRRCTMRTGRHGLVTNGAQTVSGVAFHRCTTTNGKDMEAGHRQWANGILMDNVMENGSGSVKLINRGSWGTSHGWATAHSVSWRFNKASHIQKPPTAQNYGITDIGSFSTSYPFPGPTGFQEKQAGELIPTSLYEAQLCERLNPGATPGPTPTPPPRTPTPTPTPSLGPNLALNKPASASTNWSSSFNAPKAFDGSDGSRWSASAASATNQWLRVDLGAPTFFNCVRLKEISFKRVASHVLQASADGTTFDDIPGTQGTTIGADKSVCFDTVRARYFRLFMHEARQSGSLKEPTINEVAVYRQARAPVVAVPEDLTVEATGPTGAVATFTATAIDDTVGDLPVVLTPPSGSVFPLGSTTVTARATDSDGNTASATFEVTVVDTTPPVIDVPADMTVEATSAAGAAVSFTATATDLVGGSVAVDSEPAPGSTFPLGRTAVTLTATDASENTATTTFFVTVVDTTAPVIEHAVPSASLLWPPHHEMIDVDVAIAVFEAVDVAPLTRIVGVSSSEPENGTGDGDTAPDWTITGDLTLQLRAERAGGGDGRVYTVRVESRDRFGNASRRDVEIRVPKSRGGRRSR